MADKASGMHSGKAGAAPEVDQPSGIRNIALVGHSGVGKTSLTEALLLFTGTIDRGGRVEDGTTVSDFDDAEKRQQRSIALSLAPFMHAGIKVNLVDTPGYPDFVGDLRAGLRAADGALFVVSAVDGVDGMTRMLWNECAAVGMPRAVVLTKVDHHRADFDKVTEECQENFGEGVLPLYLPTETEDGGTGLLGLLSGRLFDYASGSRVERDPDEEQATRMQASRDALIEGIIQESEDETLMDRYLGGEDIDPKVLIEDLEKAVAKGRFYPVLAAASGSLAGTDELLEVMTQAFPSPVERAAPPVSTLAGDTAEALRADPEGPLVAEVVKTNSDPYVGRVNLVRIFSGTLQPDTTVHVAGHGLAERGREDHDEDERAGQLTSPLGKTQRNITAGMAGDVCAVSKLSRAETGDTLSARERPLLMEPWTMPDPLLPVAVAAKSKADEDKLSQSLARLVGEDPTMRLEMNTETHQLVLWCMGEAHADVLMERLGSRYGVQVETVDLRVPLRETFGSVVTARGKNVKQSGGHGQYGICDVRIEPLPAGEGFEFVDKVVGGAVPRQYIPSVEKGVRQQMERGVLAGYPVVDIRVTLFDGKAHSVDSSDMAFQAAGQLALKEAAQQGSVHLLEPIDEVSVLVDDDHVGAIMGDLSSRRGRVSGTEPVAGGRTMVTAEVPETEVTRYAIDLRSLSHGTGTFRRTYVRYEPMPAHLAAKVTESAAS